LKQQKVTDEPIDNLPKKQVEIELKLPTLKQTNTILPQNNLLPLKDRLAMLKNPTAQNNN